MKKIDLAKAIGLADEKYVTEAAPEARAISSKGRRWRKIVLIAACVALIAALTTIGFIYRNDDDNLPDESGDQTTDKGFNIDDYSGSEYYELIAALNNIPILDSGAPGVSDSNKAPNSYVEVTDNQVKGVIEGDLFKRTESHIFYLDVSLKNTNNMIIRVYSIKGEESVQINSYEIDPNEGNGSEGFSWMQNGKIYLSDDGDTLFLESARSRAININGMYRSKEEEIVVMSFDVSDPANIVKINEFCINGKSSSSRMVDGKLILICRSSVRNIDYDVPSTFVPQYNRGNGYETIKMEDIIVPSNPKEFSYSVVIQLDADSFELNGIKAILSASSLEYVSEDKIFLAYDYLTRELNGEQLPKRTQVTEITALSYGHGGVCSLGSVIVEGVLKDQYSLDEYEGVLRVVTSTASNAALYCIDIATWQTVGAVRDFAPDGESVQSVRFDGTSAYVCTAVTITFDDPVFFFDLSDMNNITYTDTGNIKGYSTSLVDFGEGFLLGIGYGDSRFEPKVEVYTEKDGKVASVASYVFEAGVISEDYKSYFIDRERDLVGFQIDVSYVILHFDGTTITQKYKDGLYDDRFPERARATLIDGYFYIMSADAFRVVKLAE